MPNTLNKNWDEWAFWKLPVTIPRIVPIIHDHVRGDFVKYVRSFFGADISRYEQVKLLEKIAQSITTKYTNAQWLVVIDPNTLDRSLMPIALAIRDPSGHSEEIIGSIFANIVSTVREILMCRIFSEEKRHRDCSYLESFFTHGERYIANPVHPKMERIWQQFFQWQAALWHTRPNNVSISLEPAQWRWLEYASLRNAERLLLNLPDPQLRVDNTSASQWNTRSDNLRKIEMLRQYASREVPDVVLEEEIFRMWDFEKFRSVFSSILEPNEWKGMEGINGWLQRAWDADGVVLPIMVTSMPGIIAACSIPYNRKITLWDALNFSGVDGYEDMLDAPIVRGLRRVKKSYLALFKDLLWVTWTNRKLFEQRIKIVLLPDYEIAFQSGIVPLLNHRGIRILEPKKYDMWHRWMLDTIAPMILRREALDEFFGITLQKPQIHVTTPTQETIVQKSSVEPVRNYPIESVRDKVDKLAEWERPLEYSHWEVGHKRLLGIMLKVDGETIGYKPMYPSASRRQAAKDAGKNLLSGISLVDVTPHQVVYPENIPELLMSMNCKTTEDLVAILNDWAARQVACIRYETYVSASQRNIWDIVLGVRWRVRIIQEGNDA